MRKVTFLSLVAAATLLPAVAGAETRLCKHGTAEPIVAEAGKTWCAYLLNLYAPDVGALQAPHSEAQLVERIRDPRERTYSRSSFLQPAKHRTWTERMSTEGAIMLRVYDENGNEVPISKLAPSSLLITIGEKTERVEVSGTQSSFVVFINELATEAKLGDTIAVQFERNAPAGSGVGDEVFTRHSWFRPSDGFAIDYGVLTIGAEIDDECKDEGCALKLMPASLRLQYRIYSRTGDWYIFPGLFVGPNLAFPEDDNGDEKPFRINAVLYGAAVDLGGFEIGGGAFHRFDDGEVNPVVVVNFTEVVWRAFGFAGKFPDAILQQGD